MHHSFKLLICLGALLAIAGCGESPRKPETAAAPPPGVVPPPLPTPPEPVSPPPEPAAALAPAQPPLQPS
ncbi:MAG: hypothetical protein K9N62_05260, partial [Verrucomicrobia bacterium]|nr:hypothetical protein [Verrucomicrobiota bacterium]